MKKILIALIIVLCSFCSTSDHRTKAERVVSAIALNSERYSLPVSVFHGLRWAESMNGTLTNKDGLIYSNDKKNLENKWWVRQNKLSQRMIRKWGVLAYGCYGELQVGYLTALNFGYSTNCRPDKLNVIETNYNYGASIFKSYLDFYRGHLKRAVASYNWGHVDYDKNGDYVNQDYVNHFMYGYQN